MFVCVSGVRILYDGLCCCSYCKAVVTGIVMGSLNTMVSEQRGINGFVQLTCTHARHTWDITTKHTCSQAHKAFLCFVLFCFPWFVCPMVHSPFNINIPNTYGALWTGSMDTNTQPLTITDTKPLLLLIPSPPAVKISPPSNPYLSTHSLVSAGSLEKTCRLLVGAQQRRECSYTNCSPDSMHHLRPKRVLNLIF